MQPSTEHTEAQTTQIHRWFCDISGVITSLWSSKRGLRTHTTVSAGAEGKSSPAPDNVYSHSSKATSPSFAPTFPIYPVVEQLTTYLSL